MMRLELLLLMLFHLPFKSDTILTEREAFTLAIFNCKKLCLQRVEKR